MDSGIFGLGSITLLGSGESRSISAENPTGAKGGGATAIPAADHPASPLGQGWKASPCIMPFPARSTILLADIEGPGTIRHIWITCATRAYRECVLRMFWDGEEKPSVEAPLGDFFCNGHGIRCELASMPILVLSDGGLNCYWPMPFRRHARIEVENQATEDLPLFFYQIDYELDEVPENAATFHAQWRRARSTFEYPQHVLLDGVQGRGHYVGTYLAWTQYTDGWWGEGEFKFFIDGDATFPTICSTGLEDYFGGAWCFGRNYSTNFLGYPLTHKEEGHPNKHGVYRWHIPDPIRFKEDLRVTVQTIGMGASDYPRDKYQFISEDVASMAVWYQTEPHAPFPELPGLDARLAI